MHLLLYQLKRTENGCIFYCISRSLQKTVVSAETYRKLLYQLKLTENCCTFCCINWSVQKTVASFVVSAEAYSWSLQKTVVSFVVSKRLHLLLYQLKLTENGCIFCCVNRSCAVVSLLGDSGGVVNSLDFCPASLKSLGCFYFRCVLSSQWKAVTVNLRILHCQR